VFFRRFDKDIGPAAEQLEVNMAVRLPGCNPDIGFAQAGRPLYSGSRIGPATGGEFQANFSEQHCFGQGVMGINCRTASAAQRHLSLYSMPSTPVSWLVTEFDSANSLGDRI
jgi:hypothetical protein